jgi:predicted DNA-binding transcriptional regulator AlpA
MFDNRRILFARNVKEFLGFSMSGIYHRNSFQFRLLPKAAFPSTSPILFTDCRNS